MSQDEDKELLERLIEIICGEKMIGVEAAASSMKKDAERFRWLKQNVVFLHMAYGERDPVDGARPEWNIEGSWTKEPNGRWYPSLEEAIDKESAE